MEHQFNTRVLPRPTPISQHFWDGTRRGELLLQKCQDCLKSYFPPRPFCPYCWYKNVIVYPASGNGSLFSYIISHVASPGFNVPYSIAVVTLDEGPRMMTNVIGCEQTEDVLKLDMRLKVVFERQNDEITLPFFTPVDS